MKRIIAVIYSFILISNASFAQCSLKIDIVEIRNNEGSIMLQLYDVKKNVICQKISPVNNNMCEFSISDLKPGKYAIRYFHDENQNGRLETNLYGKPLEGYGFSNNVTGKFGAPPFDYWLFELESDKKITLKPVY